MQDLYDTFGTFGPLASAKILYPRGDDEKRKFPYLSGFIAFMARVDAERALAAMCGACIRGVNIRASWAKPVNLPTVVGCRRLAHFSSLSSCRSPSESWPCPTRPPACPSTRSRSRGTCARS